MLVLVLCAVRCLLFVVVCWCCLLLLLIFSAVVIDVWGCVFVVLFESVVVCDMLCVIIGIGDGVDECCWLVIHSVIAIACCRGWCRCWLPLLSAPVA